MAVTIVLQKGYRAMAEGLIKLCERDPGSAHLCSAKRNVLVRVLQAFVVCEYDGRSGSMPNGAREWFRDLCGNADCDAPCPR